MAWPYGKSIVCRRLGKVFIGVRTILIARVAAINEKDIKKIVALSTLSQLGLIVSSLGCK